MSGNAARLKQLAFAIEKEEQNYKSRIDVLNSQVRTLRYEKSEATSKCDELEDQVDRLKEQLEEAKDELKKAEEEKAREETRWMKEVVALRFELAEMRQQVRKWTRDDPANVEDAMQLFGLPEVGEDDDDDVIHRDSFVNAAKRGLSSVVRSILKPTVSEKRHEGLYNILGEALLELCAASGDHSDTIELLLQHGADVNSKKSRDQGGRSVLHIAAAKGHKAIIDLLIAKAGDELDIDTLDSVGRTPLHLAAKLRKAEAVKALLAKGADPTIKTPDGQTPKDLAIASENSMSFSLSFAPNVKQVFESPTVMFWNGSQLGLKYYKKQEWPKAMTHFSEAIELAKKNPRVVNKLNLSRLYYNRAKAASRLGEVLSALRDTDTALDLDSTYTNALEIRADCHWSLFDFSRAASDFKLLYEQATDSTKAMEWSKKLEEAQRCHNASHYHVLGVSKHATNAEIKRAFRTESIKWHPDKHNKSEEDAHRARVQFQRINEAKETLLDANKRIIYDADVLRRSSRRRNRYDYYDPFDDDDYYDDDDDDDEDDTNTKVYPWNCNLLSQPLHEKKFSYQQKMKEKEQQEAQARADQEEEEEQQQQQQQQSSNHVEIPQETTSPSEETKHEPQEEEDELGEAGGQDYGRPAEQEIYDDEIDDDDEEEEEDDDEAEEDDGSEYEDHLNFEESDLEEMIRELGERFGSDFNFGSIMQEQEEAERRIDELKKKWNMEHGRGAIDIDDDSEGDRMSSDNEDEGDILYDNTFEDSESNTTPATTPHKKTKSGDGSVNGFDDDEEDRNVDLGGFKTPNNEMFGIPSPAKSFGSSGKRANKHKKKKGHKVK